MQTWCRFARVGFRFRLLTGTLIILCLLGWSPAEVFAQSCDCPAPSTCGACQGGLTDLTLRFDGSVAGTVTASDNSGELFSGLVNPGATFILSGTRPDGKFDGGDIELTVDGSPDAEFETNCNTSIGEADGSFTVVAAESRDGGPMCCAPAQVETEPPVISGCPANINVSSPSNACAVAVNWIAPTASDNCTLESFTSTHLPGASFSPGVTTVTYTAEDIYGNTALCTFNITVTDDTDPVITGCPTDITIATTTGCQASVSWAAPSASDNCSATLTSNHNPGMFPVGTTAVIYTATDPSGNQQTCSFNVIVSDATNPVITGCPANITLLPTGAGCNTAVATWTAPSVTDNCSVTVTSTHASGATFSLGTTAVTYTATDLAGNISTCAFNVTVQDTSVPVITGCPANITLPATGGDSCNTAVATWTAPSATDNCLATFTSTHLPGGTFSIGTTAVTYTATDQAGNSSLCTFNVVVEESGNPVIVGCPANITLQVVGTSCSAVATWTAPTVSGGCSATLASTHTSGAAFPLGTTVVTYTATTLAGKSSSCSFNVVVQDTSAPVFTGCPASISLPAIGSSCNSAIALWTPPTVTDGCSTTITASHLPGATFSLGATTVTYTATDQAGNTSQCAFNVVVVNSATPTISKCPSDITAEATASCTAVVSWTAPTATAGCSTTVTSTHSSGDSFALGTTVVTYTVRDPAGNLATCSFKVTVRDTTIPVFSGCPANFTIEAGDACAAIASWQPPTVSDNCSASITSTHNPGTAFPMGATTVTYTAIDTKANKATCSFKVTVVDTTPPAITGCPSNLSVSTAGCNATVSWQPPVVSDKCTSTMTSDRAPGSVFPAGVTTVTYTAKDQDGNKSTCSFTVTVVDNVAPVITGCPSNINMTTTGCDEKVSWTAPRATDNCSVTMVSSHKPGDAFQIGTTVVAYTATDPGGNASTCTFNVIVTSTAPPFVSDCPSDISMKTMVESVVVTWDEPQAVAQCGDVIVKRSHEPGSKFDVGKSLVTYEFADKSGQSTMCSFYVTVEAQQILVEVSRALTPDGDGINDTWRLDKIEDFKDNRVTVVDRWGNQVYHAVGYDNTRIVWNGTALSGGKVPTGTYFYNIELRTIRTVVHQTGSIEVIQ